MGTEVFGCRGDGEGAGAEEDHEGAAGEDGTPEEVPEGGPGIGGGPVGQPGHDAMVEGVGDVVRGGFGGAGGGDEFLAEEFGIHRTFMWVRRPGLSLGLQILSRLEPRQSFAHGGAGAEGADFDEGDGPAGEVMDFLDGAFFDFKELDNEAKVGGEGLHETLDERACGVGAFVGLVGVGTEAIEPVGFLVGEVGEGGFAGTLVSAEEVVAGSDGDAHEPVFEGGFEAEAGEAFEGFEEDFLDDVFDFVFAAGVAAGGGEDAGLMAQDEMFEGLGVAGENGSDQVGVGPWVLGRTWVLRRGRGVFGRGGSHGGGGVGSFRFRGVSRTW